MNMQAFDLQPELASPSLGFAVAAMVVVAMWLAVIVILGSEGVFHARQDRVPLATITAMLLPPAIFLLILATQPEVRQNVLAIDPIWLTAMQGLRILGAVFLVAHAFGHLPWLFAYTAGWGDVLVALLAPIVVARLAADRGYLLSRGYFWFHILGMLDFIGAVGSGLLSRGTIPLLGMSESTAALGQFPLLLIPCFAVPLWICLHIAAFAQIRRGRRAKW
ncbi:hypothetical protein KHP62_19095 [Rhodobacteraceae bacterium NNCM2]|nr:hypothetical protein [Coraliihabitans acroporae]